MAPTVTLNDGKIIPQFGLGVWRLSDSEAESATSFALELGYRHIDTAAAYQNEAGVGRALKASGVPRDEVFVTTKLWGNRHRDARKGINESLERLQLDRVDLYLIHWPLVQQPGEKPSYQVAWEEFERIQADGLATSIGVSNFQPHHLATLTAATSVVPAVNQVEIHPTFRQADLQAENDRLGIATQAWSPLGQAEYLDQPEIGAIAEEVGRTPAQVILRWHLQQGRIVFPKSSRPERITENFAVFDFELSDAQLRQIDALDTGTRIGPDPDTGNFGADS